MVPIAARSILARVRIKTEWVRESQVILFPIIFTAIMSARAGHKRSISNGEVDYGREKKVAAKRFRGSIESTRKRIVSNSRRRASCCREGSRRNASRIEFG